MSETHADAADYAVVTRKPGATDQGYVASTWTQSLMKADPTARRHVVDILVDRMLDHDGVRVLLACEPTNVSTILGWICWSPVRTIRLVHYVYVRGNLRDRGIARALRHAAELDDARPLVFTMRGPCAKSLLRKYPTAIESPIGEFLQP